MFVNSLGGDSKILYLHYRQYVVASWPNVIKITLLFLLTQPCGHVLKPRREILDDRRRTIDDRRWTIDDGRYHFYRHFYEGHSYYELCETCYTSVS